MYKDVLDSFENIFIEADERLIDLFANSFGKEHLNKFKKFGFFSKNENKLKNIDQVLYAGSLGYYFRNKLTDFPKKSYLKIDQALINETKDELFNYNKKYKIGISWKSLNNKYAEQKSLSLDKLKNLLMLPDVDFINLQYGNILKEIEDFNNHYNLKLINLNKWI